MINDTDKTIAWHLTDNTFNDMQLEYYQSQQLEPEIAANCVRAFVTYCQDRIGKMEYYLRYEASMPVSMKFSEDALEYIEWEIKRCRQALEALTKKDKR